MVFKKIAHSAGDGMYLVFRVIVGLFFALHGTQKLGLTGGGAAAQGFMMFIGVCELLIGLGILAGFLTRLAATGGLIIMIGAVIKVHNPVVGVTPWMGGELAWMFLAAFLVLIANGAGKWNLEQAVLKKELLYD